MSEITDFYPSWLGTNSFGITSSSAANPSAPIFFTPLDISGCSIWFNCDDLETIVQDDVGNLSTIRNLGEIGNEAAMAAGTVSVVQDINNLNCLAFASSSLLSITATLPYTSRTAFYVYKVTSDLSGGEYVGYPYVDFFAGEANYEIVSIGYNSGDNIFEYSQGINGVDLTLLGKTEQNPYNVAQYLTLRTDFDISANNLLQINNGENLNKWEPTNVFSTNSANYTLNTSNGIATFVLGEMIEYNRVLSEYEMSLLHNYIDAKWFGAEPPIAIEPVPEEPVSIA